VPSATSSLGAAAKPGDADGLRGLSIPSIQVLNLGAVLQGLGINPATLSVTQVGNALNTLQTTVSSAAGTLNGAGLTQLSGLQQVLTTPAPAGLGGLPAATLLSAVPAPVLALVTGAIPGGLPAGVTSVGDVSNLLKSTFTTALGDLASAPLLQVNDLVVGISTKAADTVGNSAADIKASLGSINVGNLSVPGVDLASVLSNAQTTVNTVLSNVGLGNLVTVKALDQTRSVATSNGYVNALANLTGVHVAIAPLSSLAGGTTAAAGTDTMGQILGTVPALSPAMATLNTLLPTSVVGALTQGATVDVLSVGASSAFIPAGTTTANPAAPTPQNGTLAVTGGPTQVLGFIGLLLLATVAGLRWLRRPATTN